MTEDKAFKPRIIAFLCNWCSYAGADLAGTSRLKYPATILPIRVMCSSRVDPLFLLRAYLGGADGVLLTGCHPGDCHYQEGNYYTRRRFAMFSQLMDDVGLDSERLRLSWVSASEGQKYASVATDFTKTITDCGENPTKHHVFL